MVNKTFNDQAIRAHNKVRAVHGCPKLSYDSTLAREAQKWAESMAKTKTLKHSECNGYGENLAYQGSTAGASLDGAQATKMWYDEISNHDFGGQFQSNSGHFTQVIWKSTTKAGFGVALTQDGHGIYVCGRYLPAGNVMGHFTENVPRPSRSIKPDEWKVEAKRKRGCSIL